MYPQHKWRNWVQSVVLLGGMTLLLGALGWFLAGSIGLLFAAGGIAVLLIGPRVSPRVMLRMSRAQPLAVHHAPRLYHMLRALAQRADLDRLPQLYYVPSNMMNAFTIGHRDEAAIVVSDGLLRGLSTRELVGVLAHEISHLRNHDTWVMGLAEVVRRLTSALSAVGQVFLFISIPLMLVGAYSPPWTFLLLLISAPTLSTLLQLALSRQREFDADLDAARLTGDPVGLALALQKLERSQHGFWERILSWQSHLPTPSWLRTHPATEERIRRLTALQDNTDIARPLVLPPMTAPAMRRTTPRSIRLLLDAV